MGKTILILGAGRSSSSLIKYMVEESLVQNWQVIVGDTEIEPANEKISGHPSAKAIRFDVNDSNSRKKHIASCDLVISMLPFFLHDLVAADCLELGKHLVTASYVSDAQKKMHPHVKEKGLVFLNEMGADPGIDHMSAMSIIDRLKSEGKKLKSFRSFTGGLLDPAYLDNPWKYKFTWNPRNVVLSGSTGTAMFLEEGQYKYVPYHRTFSDLQRVHIEGLGEFESYANRDSLVYLNEYKINFVETLFRGTLRYAGFCNAWNVFVKLGLTDGSFEIDSNSIKTYRDLVISFLPHHLSHKTTEQALAALCGIEEESEEMSKVIWTGVLEDKPLIETGGRRSPAAFLQGLLMEKWMMGEGDIDMIVMQHEFGYEDQGILKRLVSTLILHGEDTVYTAMARGVGLPVAIGAKLILEGKIKGPGVLIPVNQSIYGPVLKELESHSIRFTEREEVLLNS